VSYLTPADADGFRLELRRVVDGRFQEPILVAEGDDWFVNWADFPALACDADGNLAVCWLQKLGAATFAYGVRVRCSIAPSRVITKESSLPPLAPTYSRPSAPIAGAVRLS